MNQTLFDQVADGMPAAQKAELLAGHMASMAENYWTLGNDITAFAVVQMIALVIAVAGKTIPRRSLQDNWVVTIALFAAGTFLYCYAVYHCYEMEQFIIDKHADFKVTVYGRMALIILTNMGGVLWVVKMHTEDSKKP
ncbi:MAG: hypothetical protein JSS38_11210 [Nitrospira sp.]|nr:hypothetical protein [Nitrospira sp.]